MNLIHNKSMITKNKFLSLIFITIIMIYSLMNNYTARYINPIYYNNFIKQLVFILTGIFLMICIYKIRTSKLLKFHYAYYITSLIMLGLVLIFGKEVNGARAWFDFGFISFQPSEFMKFTLALTLTKLTYDFNKSIKKNELLFIIKIIFLTLIPSVLVFVEPDTGAIIFYLLIFLIAFLSAKIKMIWKLGFFILSTFLILFTVYIYFNNPIILTDLIGPNIFYRIDRLINFQDNYQINNAMTLMGSTSFFGSNSLFTNLNLPEAPTDFMYAFNFYNYGLFGCFTVTISYFLLCLIIIIQTFNKKCNIFKKMFIVILFFGVFYNILMNIGLVPIMGIALPFFSYGGSSLLVYFMFLGIYFKEL